MSCREVRNLRGEFDGSSPTPTRYSPRQIGSSPRMRRRYGDPAEPPLNADRFGPSSQLSAGGQRTYMSRETQYIEERPREAPVRWEHRQRIGGRWYVLAIYGTAESPSDGTAAASPSPRKQPRKQPRFQVRRRHLGWGPGTEKRRKKAGTCAIREIKRLQGKKKWDRAAQKDVYTWGKDATKLLINKTAFQKLVREICCDCRCDLRMTVDALSALHHAAESHLIDYFQDANLCAIGDGRETLKVRDMRLACKLRRESMPMSWEKWLDNNPGCFARVSRRSDQFDSDARRNDGVAHKGPSHNDDLEKRPEGGRMIY